MLFLLENFYGNQYILILVALKCCVFSRYSNYNCVYFLILYYTVKIRTNYSDENLISYTCKNTKNSAHIYEQNNHNFEVQVLFSVSCFRKGKFSSSVIIFIIDLFLKRVPMCYFQAQILQRQYLAGSFQINTCKF